MSYKKIIPIVCFLFGFAELADAQGQIANIKDPRLQITLPTVKGDSLTLASLQGKVILLDFWASWCPPCRIANRQMVKIYAKYKSQGFEIFGVSMDEEKKDWARAIKGDKISWLQVNDPRGGWEAKTAQEWNISVLPTSFLINKKGDVVAVDLTPRELDKAIKELLQE